MSDELRMDLADCGSPEALIAVILKYHPQLPRCVPVRELATSVGIIDFKELETESFEGALRTDFEKTKGVILTKAGAREERVRFTIGHELGHFLIPSHKGDRDCTAADLRENGRKTDHQRREDEANRFSAGLLMPKPSFIKDMQSLGTADVMHAQSLATDYGTSLEATCNRYVELTDDACAFVFSKDGIVRYARPSRHFPKLAVRQGDRLPSRSATLRTTSAALRVASSWVEMDGSIWLESEWGKRSPTVLEQTYRQKNGFQITLLFIDQSESDDDNDGEDSDHGWAAPRF